MPASPRTTTSPPPTGQFEPPDCFVNEAALRAHLKKDINAENFQALIASNFLVALDAHDRKLTRDMFEDVLVTTFNFQNRLVRISELNIILERLDEGRPFDPQAMRDEVNRHMDSAVTHQAKLLGTLMLFEEMRGPEDSVS